MSRATYVYILILAAFGVGLWVTLSLGSIFLQAPTDLSGRWQLFAMDGPSAKPEHEIVLQQSGRFVRVELDHEPYSLKLTHDDLDAKVELIGIDGLEMTFSGDLAGDSCNLTIAGPIHGTWLASRVVRTYRKRSTGHPTTSTNIHAGH